MQRKLPALLLFALIVATFLAGCGDDSSDGSDASGASSASNGSSASNDSSDSGDDSDSAPEPVTASKITKAEYVKKGNAICVRGRADRFNEVNSFAEQNRDKSEKELLPEVVEDIYGPGLDAQFEELRDLGAPPGDEDRLEAMIVAFEKVSDLFVEAEGGQSTELNKEIEHAGRLARKYGLDECSFI